MLSYLRRRLQGWDGLRYSEPEIRHLSQYQREHLTKAARQAVRHHPRYRFMIRLLSPLFKITLALAVLLLLMDKLYMHLLLMFGWALLIQWGIALVWYFVCFRQSLRQILLDAGLRPAFCFECSHNLEGFEGNACPACHAPLLRRANSSPENT
jgi:hypothetical protein